MGKRKTIILVDDQIHNLTFGVSTLSREYRVLAVTSGKKLLALLKKVVPDLILLDIDMPEMNGLETIRQIRKNPKNEHIPVIFLIGRDDTHTEAEAFALGAADCVHKPLISSVLLKKIGDCLLLKPSPENGEPDAGDRSKA